MIVSKSAMVPIKSQYDTRPFNLNENRIEFTSRDAHPGER